MPRLFIPPFKPRPKIPPTDDEKKIGWGRAYGSNTDPYKQVRRHIDERGFPRIVCIGSSHVTHWASYRRRLRGDNPDRDVLAHFTFAGVGGVKLINLIDQIGGIGLPKKKAYLGNQWLKLAKLHKKPAYCVLMVGSNDCKDVHHFTKARARKCVESTTCKSATLKEIAKWFTDLKYHQMKIVEKIRSLFKGIRIYFMPILPRHWWGHYGNPPQLKPHQVGKHTHPECQQPV